MKVVKQNVDKVDFTFECKHCNSTLQADYWEIRLAWPWIKDQNNQRFLLSCEFCSNPNIFKPEEIDIDQKLKEGILSRGPIQIRNEEMRKELHAQVDKGVKYQSLGYTIPVKCEKHPDGTRSWS